MAAITYQNASCIYPGADFLAVDSLNLEIEDGEFLVLVGPSGSGKSTALRMLAGLEDIDEGSISIGGRDVTNVQPKDRDIAMVFQSYALYPHMTVAQNMGFALKLRGMPKPTIKQKVAEAAEMLDLSRYLDRRPKALSGGQRQRVAMGRAIVREPSVFLMDEPLSNLDAKLRVEMRSEVLRIHNAIGAATLYVTHDQVEAMTMGDRVAVLYGGVLQQYATPRELYECPANLFVASFIGSPEMNLYEASVADGELVLGSQRLALGGTETVVASYRGRKVIAGVRPEDLELDTAGQAETAGRAGQTTLATDVLIVEPLGSETHVFFAIDAPAVGASTLAAAAGETEAGMLAGPAHNGVA